MKLYMVDTCVISEIMKPKPNNDVVEWLCDNSNELRLSSVTVKELYYGALRMDDGKRKDALLTSIENIIWLYNEDIIPFDKRAAVVCARMHNRVQREGFTPTIEDLEIAATCLSNDMTLVTRNVKDFDYLGVPLFNPFEMAAR